MTLSNGPFNVPIDSMMDKFSLYLHLGFQHIANIHATDHLLFVVVLCIRYLFSDWKKLLVLITAFTIGHSITLALSVFQILHLSPRWIEFLIPITIVLTGLSNIFVKKFTYKTRYPFIYYMALFFGLIHGLGFSNYLRSLLGRSNSIVVELLAFNIGLELGQLAVVLLALLITFICLNLLHINRREYILFVSGCIFGVALQMAILRYPF